MRSTVSSASASGRGGKDAAKRRGGDTAAHPRGTSGVVRAATVKATGDSVAVKIIRRQNMNAYEKRALDNELQLQRLRHNNIVTLIQAVDTEAAVYIVTERLHGGELFDHIIELGRYTEENARTTFRQIAEAVKYLHAQGVVKRDIKPENLLLADQSEDAPVKLCDFGIAKVLDVKAKTGASKLRRLTRTMTKTGSPGYIAPEVMRGQPYGKTCDLWSLGCVLYAMLIGKMPPDPADVEATLSDSGDWASVSSNAKDLVATLLSIEPADRGDIEGVLSHPWLLGKAPSRPLLMCQRSLEEQVVERRRQRAGFLAVSFATGLRGRQGPMAEPLSLDHARLELKRIGGADSALKILKRACGGGGLRDAAVIAHSTALILASCAQDGAAAVEIGAAASWATVVTTVFAQDEAAGSSVDAATRALVQRLLADAITSVASVSEAASPLRSALMSAADTGRPPLAVLAAGLRQQLRALGEAPASPDAAPHMEACSRVFAALGSLAATDALEPVAGKGTESPFARACLQEGAVDAALAAAQLNVATGQDGADHTEAASSADDGFRARVGDLEGAAFNCLADIALASQPAASHVLAWQGVHTFLSRYADVGRRPVPSTGATAAAAVARLVAALWATSLAEAADAFRGEAAAVLDAAGGCMASEDVALQDTGCALVANLVLQVADKEALRASAACRSFHQRMLQGSECLLPLAWLLDSRADAVQRRAAQVFAHMRRKRDNDLMVSMVEQGAVPAIHALAREGTRKASPGRDAARDAFGYIKDELRGAFLSLLLRSLDMEGNHKRRANIAVAFIHVSSSSRDVCLEFAGSESPSSALFAVAGMATDEGGAGRAAAVPCFRALLPLARSLAPRAAPGTGSALDAIDAEATQHEDLFNNKTSSDIKLMVGPDATPLHAHKAVLRAASPGLAAVVDRAEKEGLRG